MTDRGSRIVRILTAIGVAGVVVVLGGLVWRRCCSGTQRAEQTFTAILPEVRAPNGVRVRVEVLNATTTPRLAMAATRVLRDRGFDVVSTGNHSMRRDTTLVLDRTGHPDWARLVVGVLGTGVAQTRVDTSRYVDVSVLLGADWAPPGKPFDP
jgi:hypothetical protein